MAMTRKKWAVSALAVECNKDRRFMAKIVEDIEPAGKTGYGPTYWMSDVIAAMMDRDDLDLTAEKARLAKAQADKTEIEVALKQGEIVLAEDAADVWGVQISNIRAKLLALGHTLAPQVAVETDVPACCDIVDVRVREILVELRDFAVGEDKAS
jgi:hypothetical protein